MSPSFLCEWCGEAVLPTEQRPSFEATRMHLECAMRSGVGSVGHILRRCSCYRRAAELAGGRGVLGDPPAMTKREAALAAFALLKQIHEWYGEAES
jgi:hypothetical protein